MSSLEAAQRRLEDALRRIEAAASRRATTDGGDGAPGTAFLAERNALVEGVGQLRGECERLNEALDAAQRDNEALRRLNEEVARRLDGTIDELQQLLEA